jgi:hypothetical protein
MRKLPMPEFETDGAEEDWVNNGRQCTDWKENPESVLDSVDYLLKPFGLEVVMYETHADDYVWEIAKREA